MKTQNTAHGPLAIENQAERDQLNKSLDILKQAIIIESDQGKLHHRNYTDLAAAYVALTCYLQYLGKSTIVGEGQILLPETLLPKKNPYMLRLRN